MEVVAATNLGGRRPPWQDLPSELLGLVLQRVLSHITAAQTGSQVSGGKVITISIRRPQSTTVEWQWQWIPHGGTYWPHPYHVLDMALFQHKLYVLTAAAVGACHYYQPLRLRLYAMDIVGGNHVNVQRVLMRPQDDVDRWHHGGPRHYLVASGDRLLMVKQTSPLLMPAWFEVLEAADIGGGRGRWRDVETLMGRALFVSEGCSDPLLMPAWFEVLEAADIGGGRGRWRDVETLMGRALFVSEGCSESLPAGDGKYGGAREDCIYFLKEHNNYGGRMSDLCSGVYDMRRGTVSPLPKFFI